MGVGRCMRMIGWANQVLDDDVLAEPVLPDGRITLWVPIGRDRDFHYWKRIGATPRGETSGGRGVRSAPATAFRVKRRAYVGLFRTLAAKLRRGGGEAMWVLPDGTTAERCGGRRTDLLLAWSDDGPLGEEHVRDRWPDADQIRRLGERLFLVEGVARREAAADDSGGRDSSAGPIDAAERLMESARRRGDRRGEAAALTDLGVLLMNMGDGGGAVERFHGALDLCREQGDPSGETDVLSNLGYALLTLDRPRDAMEVLKAALAIAQATGDAYARKLLLERLAMAHANLRDPAGSLAILDQAMAMTRAAGDRQQEFRLLWMQAIALAELNRRDLAVAKAEESTSLLRALGKPEAAWYEEQLHRYRDEASIFSPGFYMKTAVEGQSSVGSPSGPGLLRMAFSATKAMAAFIGSGMKTASADVQRTRLAACRSCEHHTGLRCRVCGCFTNAKSRMAHERCPLERWPA